MSDLFYTPTINNGVDTLPDTPAEKPKPAPLLPTDAAAFKRRRDTGEVYRLPGSGLCARIRPQALSVLVTRGGGIPNALGDEVLRLLIEGRPSEGTRYGELPDTAKQLESYRKYLDGVITVARLVFVEPRIVDDFRCGECDYTWNTTPRRGRDRCPKCQATQVLPNEPNYEGGEIALLDLHDLDLFFAWRVTQEGADSLAPFRQSGGAGATG